MTQGTGTPGPVWTPDIWLSPTKLKSYASCPHRARLQYLDKVMAPQPFNLFLVKGNIAHDLLRLNAQMIRAHLQIMGEGEMRTRALRKLPANEFHSDAARNGAVNDVLRWVHYGTGCIDRKATFLNIEQPGKRDFPVPALGARMMMSTRPDLIQVRLDDNGDRLVEIVDYKTGSMAYVDEVPPVAMRFVFKELLGTILAETPDARIQFTYVYLDHADRTVIPLTHEYCTSQWETVNGVIERLVLDREWVATPSKLCNYCPYNGNACTAFATWVADVDDTWG